MPCLLYGSSAGGGSGIATPCMPWLKNLSCLCQRNNVAKVPEAGHTGRCIKRTTPLAAYLLIGKRTISIKPNESSVVNIAELKNLSNLKKQTK